MSKKKYGPLETSSIGAEEYDIIHSEGYSACLKDMIVSLKDMLVIVEKNELDLEEYVQQLIERAEETLSDESSTIN